MANYPLLFSTGFIADWYLHKSQIKLLEFIRNRKYSVVLSHRRFGKSTTILTHVCERAMQERIIIRWGGVTQAKTYEIVNYLLDEIYQKAPQLKPRFQSSDRVSRYVWPITNSEMYVFGNANSEESDKARGTMANIIVADERAFWKFKPYYMLRSILMPQVDKVEGSQIILTSSAPEDLSHPFIQEIQDASAKGNLFNQKITDTILMKDISEEEHQNIIERSGGIESETYKREYLNCLIPTKQRLVIPEAQNESLYIGESERPPYLDSYVSFDLGFVDCAFGLFAYYDFAKATLVIERELKMNYSTTREIVEAALIIETDLKYKPYKRFADNELQQIADMQREHKYNIIPIIKRSKQSNMGFRDSVLNNLRIAISTGRIKINPICTNLIAELKYGIWNENRTDYERSESLGHLDGISSLCYLWDNIEQTKNPYPSIASGCDRFNNYIPTGIDKNKNIESLQQAFGRGKDAGKQIFRPR